MRAGSIESTLVWMRQRASRWHVVSVGCAVAVAAAVAVAVVVALAPTDGSGDGAADATVGDAGAGDALVAPVPQPAMRTARRPLRSARELMF
jgi:hypothetical protein